MEKNNGEICIIKYFVAMRYAKEKLNEILPSPETFNMILTLGVFYYSYCVKRMLPVREIWQKVEKTACLPY